MNTTSSAKTSLLFLVSAVPLISACYPRLHEYYSSQEYVGTLSIGSTPVANATVLISNSRGDKGSYCDNVIAKGATDEAGSFRIQSVKSLHIFASILNPPEQIFQGTAVCFRVNDRESLGAVIVSRTDRPISHALSCNLGAPRREFKQAFKMPPDEQGICTNPA
jgi:hypothetical protein